MFSQKLRLITGNAVMHLNSLRSLNIAALGTCETEIIEKWKQKFASENISEPDESIKHILKYVISNVIVLNKEENEPNINGMIFLAEFD